MKQINVTVSDEVYAIYQDLKISHGLKLNFTSQIERTIRETQSMLPKSPEVSPK